ncbi:MAG: hypothetical protein ACXVDH_03480 [Nocardioides sp.]
MRRFVVLIAALPLLAGCGSHGEVAGGSASCVGPHLDAYPPGERGSDQRPIVAVGGEITVYGHWFTDVCNDTNHDIRPLTPLGPVAMTLTLPGNGAPTPLGTFTPAGPDLGFSARVRIPQDAPAGAATVADEAGHTFTFRITAN